MNATQPAFATPTPAARFNGPLGYQLEGDSVRLNARISPVTTEACQRNWALQLWASHSPVIDQHAVKVAELPIGPLTQDAELTDALTLALPPAGTSAHTMMLALVSTDADAQSEIHDLSVFPREEQFVQPRLEGNVAYTLDDHSATLRVDGITNPRDQDNCSGTLALELWALTETYAGGAFNGHCLSRAELGALSGQHGFTQIEQTTALNPAPAGSWQLCLMLREWTPAGFVTRDYSNFGQALQVAAPASDVAEPEVAAVAEAAEEAPAAAESAAVETPVAEAAPVTASATEVAAEVVAEVTAEVAPVEETVTAKPAKGNRKGSKSAKAAPEQVSVNDASVEQLATVKGITKALARTIVDNRPHASVDDLLSLKGMGAKTLAKVRDQLCM